LSGFAAGFPSRLWPATNRLGAGMLRGRSPAGGSNGSPGHKPGNRAAGGNRGRQGGDRAFQGGLARL